MTPRERELNARGSQAKVKRLWSLCHPSLCDLTCSLTMEAAWQQQESPEHGVAQWLLKKGVQIL